MFQRIRLFEPGIKHSMWESKIRRPGSIKRAPDSKTVVLPDSVNDDDVILCLTLREPPAKPRRITIFTEARAERINGNGTLLRPFIVRSIQRNNFHSMTPPNQLGGRLHDRLNRAT